MVNVVRAIATMTAVYTPAIINCADSQSASMRAAVGFGIRNFLTCIFRYFGPALEVSERETSFAFDI